MNKKPWYTSKTLWVNFLALIASFLQLKYGIVFEPALQGVVLTLINIVLRIITREEVVWENETK
ncbi:MAG: hypothetical protein QXT73_00750 [Candidatus Methanomethylicaceae archaeon]